LYLFNLVLEKRAQDVDKRAADMWSFGVLLWEVSTRQVPFGECSAMQCGLRVRDGMRLELPVGMSSQMQKLIRICMNEEAVKRPRFEMILPILEKLNR
jgi:integrin-linked kinase